MAFYIVSCRLSSPGRSYDELIEAVENVGTSWQCLGATWLVNTDKAAAEIRDELRPFIDNHDDILVAGLTGEAAWRGGSHFVEQLRTVFTEQPRSL